MCYHRERWDKELQGDSTTSTDVITVWPICSDRTAGSDGPSSSSYQSMHLDLGKCSSSYVVCWTKSHIKQWAHAWVLSYIGTDITKHLS